MHPMENKSWGKAHVITLHRERGQLKFQDTRWGEKEEQEGSRERKYKVQGPMLTRWPQLHEQTSPVFHLNAHLETGHTEPPHLRISSRKKKTRHFLTYLLCISCLLLVLVLCCVTSAPVTSGQGSASVCLIDSDRGLGKWWGLGDRAAEVAQWI